MPSVCGGDNYAKLIKRKCRQDAEQKGVVTYDGGKSSLPEHELADTHGRITDRLWLKQEDSSLDALGPQSFPRP